MTEVTSGVEGGAAPAGGEGGAPAAPPREWMTGLPEDLRGDATLARYETPEALARGHLEARRALSTRVAVPGADADDATRNAFYSAIGRPETAEGYEFKVADTDAAREGAGAFAKFAFERGMPKDMAQAVVEFDEQRNAAQLQQYQDNARAEFDAWKADKPDHEARISQIGNMLKRFNGDEMTVAEVEARLGTRKMFDLFDGFAQAMGEHARQDGDPNPPIGGGNPAGDDPDKVMNDRMKDADFRAKINAKDPDAIREYDQMLAARREAAAARDKGRKKPA